MQLLEKMILLAVNAHAGQMDKGGIPYILHPITVLQEVMNLSDDEELACIAILHDVIEDTDVTFIDLYREGATARIVNGVVCLTKMPGETYEEYKERVFSNRDAMIVKMADLRHNSNLARLKGITEKDIKRAARYLTFYYELSVRLNHDA
jgi:guanosine-3',5'-bis(diphosphate) 3'-pyrophosphohydrolase